MDAGLPPQPEAAEVSIPYGGHQTDLKPFRPNEGCYQLLSLPQRAVVRRAQNVIDSHAVLGEWK